MLAQRSRQLGRQMARATAAAAERKPQARPTWGDRRLNRQKRYAHLALIKHMRRAGLLLRPMAQAAIAALAARFGLPPHFVLELTSVAGMAGRMDSAA